MLCNFPSQTFKGRTFSNVANRNKLRFFAIATTGNVYLYAILVSLSTLLIAVSARAEFRVREKAANVIVDDLWHTLARVGFRVPSRSFSIGLPPFLLLLL